MSLDNDDVLRRIDQYYTRRLREHGATPSGVDWNSEASQRTRFEQLARVFSTDSSFSVLDYGCGYGALADFLGQRGARARYTGFDVSEAMIESARGLHPGTPDVTFTSDANDLAPVDYSVASGVLNVKMDVSLEDWERYVFLTIDRLAELGIRGFAFNALTAYSDPDRMRADLYYADPHRLFDYCRTRFSRWVALLHDYGLYEFTVVVRRA